MKTTHAAREEIGHLDSLAFRRVAGTFASGVTAITTMVRGRPHGCAANAVSSLSLEPPLMLICLAHTSKTHSQLREAGVFAINILDDSSESRALCRSFALRSEDRFIDVDYRVGTIGVPILNLAMSWMECKLVDAYDAGDHTIFIGRVLAAEDSERKPLVYFRGKFGSLLADQPT
jgi:flavin reductase (DIM6/NTAB) family NADH-FMN oxidoreductase RutF